MLSYLPGYLQGTCQAIWRARNHELFSRLKHWAFRRLDKKITFRDCLKIAGINRTFWIKWNPLNRIRNGIQSLCNEYQAAMHTLNHLWSTCREKHFFFEIIWTLFILCLSTISKTHCQVIKSEPFAQTLKSKEKHNWLPSQRGRRKFHTIRKTTTQ